MLKQLTSLGIENDFSRSLKFKVRLTNTLAALTLLLALIYSGAHFYSKDSLIVVSTQFSYFIFGVLILFFNSRQKFLLGEYTLFIVYPIWFAITALMIGIDYQMEYYLLITGIGAIVVFRKERKRYLLMFFNFTLFFICRIFFIFHPESLVELNGDAFPYIYYLNGFIPFVVICLIMNQTFNNNLRIYLNFKDITTNQEDLIEERTNEIKAQSLALQQSNNELKRFSYISAHDLREPLRNIMSFSQLLNRDLKSGKRENIQEYLQYMTNGVNRIDSLTKDIVNYTALEEQVPQTTSVSTERIVGQLFSQFSEPYPNLKSTTKALPKIEINEELCELLFRNLILNAIQYCDKAVPIVNISAKKKGAFYLFSIEDNGIGIEEEYHDVIFEMFKRLHNDLDKSGSGIGLAFCKKIINAYQGEIWVESTEDVGSIFYFTFPTQLN